MGDVLAQATADPFFWCLVRVSSMARQPLDVAQNILQKGSLPDELGNLFYLVTAGLTKVTTMFDKLLVSGMNWVRGRDFEKLSAEDAMVASEIAHALLLHNVAAFHRRFIVPLSRFPCRLLLMLQADGDEPCPQLSRVAKDLLATRDGELDSATRKLKALYFQDLPGSTDCSPSYT